MKGIACVILILGLLKFAQDAPNLFKSIFSFGGDLLKGLNLDPRVGMKENLGYAKKAGSAVFGGLGGAIAGTARGIRQAGQDHNAVGGQDGFGRKFHTLTAGVAGGLRGMVRGGRNGFQNSSGNMFNQLMSGTEQGNIAAQMNSQHYRDGGSANPIGRFIHNAGTTLSDFGHDHFAEPWRNFAGNVSGRNTSSEAAQIFVNTKANNTAAMTATGTNIAVTNLTNARDEAKNKIREANALGMNYGEMLAELGMTAQSARDKAAQLAEAGYKVNGVTLDANGNAVVDESKFNAKTLQDIVDGTFKTDKLAALNTNFNNMNNKNKKIIAEYNKETVDNLKDNMGLLSEADLSSLFSGMAKDAAFHDAFKSGGFTITKQNNKDVILDRSGNVASTDQLRSFVMQNLEASTNANTVSGSSMMQLDALQSQLKKVNDTIENRKALEEHQRSQRRRGNSSDSGNSSSGGNSGSGGAS